MEAGNCNGRVVLINRLHSSYVKVGLNLRTSLDFDEQRARIMFQSTVWGSGYGRSERASPNGSKQISVKMPSPISKHHLFFLAPTDSKMFKYSLQL